MIQTILLLSHEVCLSNYAQCRTSNSSFTSEIRWHFSLFLLSPRAPIHSGRVVSGPCVSDIRSGSSWQTGTALLCVGGLIFIDLKLNKLFLNKHVFLYTALASGFLAQYSPYPLCKKRQKKKDNVFKHTPLKRSILKRLLILSPGFSGCDLLQCS